MGTIFIIPLWQRGMEGDFMNAWFLFELPIIYKISPHPSLLKRGEKKTERE